MKLKNKIIIGILSLFVINYNNYNALEYEISNESNEFYEQGDSICANTPLNLKTDSEATELKVVDKESGVVLNSETFGRYNNQILFPVYEKPIVIQLESFDPKTMEPIEVTKFETNISQCDTVQVLKNPYEIKVPKTKITSSGSSLTFTKTGDELINTMYQSVDYELFANVKYKDGDSVTVDIKDYDIIQFAETTVVDGKEIIDYYELELNDDGTFFIRSVNGFDLQVIKMQQMIDLSSLLIALFALLLSYISLLISKKYGRKYKRNQQERKIRSRK